MKLMDIYIVGPGLGQMQIFGGVMGSKPFFLEQLNNIIVILALIIIIEEKYRQLLIFNYNMYKIVKKNNTNCPVSSDIYNLGYDQQYFVC